MGTAKRERQKANRQLRLQEIAKEQRKEKSKKVAFRVVGAIVLFFVLAGGIYLLGRDGSSSSSSSSTSTLPGVTTTGAPTTTISYPTPEKPTVKAPGADVTALKVTVLKEGSGDAAVAGDTVVVHYIGVLSKDGKDFDNSYDRGQPFPVVLGANSVIQGWEQGLLGAKKGSQIQLDIPSDLAYGDAGRPPTIPGGASLTFVIDVMDVIPPAGATSTTAAPQTTAPQTTAPQTTATPTT